MASMGASASGNGVEGITTGGYGVYASSVGGSASMLQAPIILGSMALRPATRASMAPAAFMAFTGWGPRPSMAWARLSASSPRAVPTACRARAPAFGVFASSAATGVEGVGSTGVKGISSDANGSAGYFVNTAGSGQGTAVTADGLVVGLSATANTGYAVEASGYGGGDFTGAINYGVNATSNGSYAINAFSKNSWGVVVNAPNGNGVVSYSAYGIYSSSTNGNAVQGTSSAGNGVEGDTTASGNNNGVYGGANCATCNGGYFINSASSGSASGIYAEGYTTGISATARSGTAFRAYGSTGYYATAGSGGINFYSDASNNPSYGFYHYAAPTSTAFGLYDLNNNPTGHAAFLYNLSPASTDSGDALYVRGKIRATDVAGKYIGGSTAVTSWVINNSMVEATSIIMVTPGITVLAVIPCSSAALVQAPSRLAVRWRLANLPIYYWIVSR